MFTPSRDEVRRFFFDTWTKYVSGRPLEGLEQVAISILLDHPEYRPMLEDPARFADRDWTPETGESNPFLHLSLHLAIEEQLSIDQPPGIRAELDRMLAQGLSAHDARHAILECLGEMLWEAQRLGTAPDGERYLACIRGRTPRHARGGS
ncbi:MAG: DUF1841 family protein [Betaproteobacteria bacterium]|nr:DUF1841 family protein [Betaproteobacteria bacterium]